ncbi:MAG: hypothetical protein KIT83_09060 [Bryobacterales bacterium]|nr:hypothetical protein [Bryobacterales bacterium]
MPPELLLRAEFRAAEMLERQITDAAHPGHGGYMDGYGMLAPQSGAGVIATLGAVWMCPGSRYYRTPEVAARIRLAAGFLERMQLPSGNIDLLTTNFDSPPDTGFVVHAVAPVAILANRANERQMASALTPFLNRAGAAMAVGGVHTPNHRWVVTAALALLHHLEPNPAYPRRITEWLAEGIDIDADGLYTERSPLVYTPVVNRSLIYMAEFQQRSELLEPVNRSLQAALWLMHANGELVTELSGRQDQNTVGSMGVNWLALRYLGNSSGNGIYTGLANRFQADHGDLLQWLLLPMLQRDGGEPAEPPASYEKDFREAAVWRFRDGALSATLLYRGYDRILSIRKGDAVVEAVRFASAFFGKGQFVADEVERDGDTFTMRQRLKGPYFQPLNPPEEIPSDPHAWSRSRQRRAQSEVATLEQRCTLRHHGNVFTLEISVSGTSHVPVSVELNVRDGAEISGVRTAPMSADSFLTTGSPMLLRTGRDQIKVEAPAAAHGYTLLRGALPKLPGRSIYITAQTPFLGSIVFS